PSLLEGPGLPPERGARRSAGSAGGSRGARGPHAGQGHRRAGGAGVAGDPGPGAGRRRGDEDGERAARAAGRGGAGGDREAGRHGGSGCDTGGVGIAVHRPYLTWAPEANARLPRLQTPARVTVVEVGPRDGLQNEAAPLSVEDRVAFCDSLLAAGLTVVE